MLYAAIAHVVNLAASSLGPNAASFPRMAANANDFVVREFQHLDDATLNNTAVRRVSARALPQLLIDNLFFTLES